MKIQALRGSEIVGCGTTWLLLSSEAPRSDDRVVLMLHQDQTVPMLATVRDVVGVGLVADVGSDVPMIALRDAILVGRVALEIYVDLSPEDLGEIITLLRRSCGETSRAA